MERHAVVVHEMRRLKMFPTRTALVQDVDTVTAWYSAFAPCHSFRARPVLARVQADVCLQPRWLTPRLRRAHLPFLMSSDPSQEHSLPESPKETLSSDPHLTDSTEQLEHINAGSDHSGGDHNGSDNGNENSNNYGDGDERDAETLITVPVDKKATTSETSVKLGVLVDAQFAAASRAYQHFRGTVFSWAAAFLKTVPAPVLVALISLVSTVSGARVKASRDAQTAERARMEAARKQKREIEKMLRQLYADLAAPMLKSAAKLAERLQILVDADWDAVESRQVDEIVSPLYSAYLLGRYLATVEIIKEKSALLDYGFPSADRILANILGRVQGILAANDKILADMQMTEHLFKPEGGKKPLRAGPLKITPRAQTVLGELMLRRLWKDKYDFVDSANGADLTAGAKAMINFLEFSRVFTADDIMRKWYKPVVKDFQRLEKTILGLAREKRRVDGVGARVYFLQSCLLDLVEFYDPLPHPKFVPFSKRRRLRLGSLNHTEEQRAPMSLHKLYTELANIRDHRLVEGDIVDRLRLPQGVEVYVSGSYGTGECKVQKSEFGDCPFSHRVLITLQEMGIPYRAVGIAPDAKPGWYYLLHPESRTPALYYDGEVVEESGHIVSYLVHRFPKAKQLASADHLKLAVGTASFTRFHTHFKSWLSGDRNAKRILELELGKLDNTLQLAQDKNEGKPFLGGCSFSREDTAIAPMLHNMEVAGRAVKDWSIPKKCRAIWKYLAEARRISSFAETVAKDAVIIEGYSRLAKAGGERMWRLADFLE